MQRAIKPVLSWLLNESDVFLKIILLALFIVYMVLLVITVSMKGFVYVSVSTY